MCSPLGLTARTSRRIIGCTDADRVATMRQQLGWTESWLHRVCESTLAFVCAAGGVRLDDLSERSSTPSLLSSTRPQP
jgi:hypothetical protein